MSEKSLARLFRQAQARCVYCRENRPVLVDDKGLFHSWHVRGGLRQEDCAAETIRLRMIRERQTEINLKSKPLNPRDVSILGGDPSL